MTPLFKPRPAALALGWLLGAVFVFLLAGCGANGGETPTLPATAAPDTAPTPAPTPTSAAPDRAPYTLRLWLPPELDPDSGSPAADLLQNQLETFAVQHPGVQIEVRLKTLNGAGNLLESVAAARAVAPAALPDLVALPRADLESAAIKGLLYPFPGLQPAPPTGESASDLDWYDYAQRLARVDNTLFGIPFAGDTLVLLYRPAAFDRLPTSWLSLQDAPQPLFFAAQALPASVPLTFYLANGGALTDEQGRPTLDQLALLETLNFFANGRQSGQILPAYTSYTNESSVIDAFRIGQANLGIVWLSQALAADLDGSALAALPTPGVDPIALVNGWAWALTTPDPERQALAIALAHHLTASDFLGQWSLAAGYLPPRPSAAAAWNGSPHQPLLSRTVLTAQIIPPQQILNTIGPALQKATLQVIAQRATPQDAAAQAVNQLAP